MAIGSLGPRARRRPARLGGIGVPTLLVTGTGDRMPMPDSMLPFLRHVPRLYHVYIYGAAHELPISAGPQWVRLVADFVDRGEAFVVNAGEAEGG